MFQPTYPILTPRLLLRPFVPDDLDALYAIQCRPDVARYLYWLPRSREQVAEVLASRIAHPALETEGDRLVLAVVLRDSGVVIGDTVLIWLSEAHKQGEIGYVFHPEHHGRGLAGEAAREMLRLGFEGLGLHRISARCDARNIPSARLMERLGMRQEAHYRENELFKGEWSDEYVYAMLAAKWMAGDRDVREPAVHP